MDIFFQYNIKSDPSKKKEKPGPVLEGLIKDGKTKEFNCNYCGKNYKNFYSRDAKNHNEDLGGVCPLRQLHNTGITIKDKSEVEKYIFNKAMSDIDIITLE